MSVFEEKLKELFDNTEDIIDTLWYTNTETLFDAIVRIHDEEIDKWRENTT